MHVKLFITPDGHVRDALWTRANAPQTHALGCITEAMRTWTFGPTGYDTEFVAQVPLTL